jgi:hypothetical protein
MHGAIPPYPTLIHNVVPKIPRGQRCLRSHKFPSSSHTRYCARVSLAVDLPVSVVNCVLNYCFPLNDTHCRIDRYRKPAVVNNEGKLMVTIHLIQLNLTITVTYIIG